jgi:uncharacterized protein (TIGR02271 family)
VVTENVTQTVSVSHEEVRVERRPITDANRDAALSGSAITEEEHKVVLNAERPVVEKETVPVEQVRFATDTVTEQQEVNEQVRKEQIEERSGWWRRRGRTASACTRPAAGPGKRGRSVRTRRRPRPRPDGLRL